MIRRLHRLITSQLGLFLLVGGLAAGSQWLSRFGFNRMMPYPAAVVLAYGVGMVIAFELNRRFVFPSEGQARHRQAVRFALVNVLSFATVWVVSVGLGEMLLPHFMRRDWAEAVGHGFGVLSPALASYFLHKNYTFSAAAPAVAGAEAD